MSDWISEGNGDSGPWHHPDPDYRGFKIRPVIAGDTQIFRVTLNGKQTRDFDHPGHAMTYVANFVKIMKQYGWR